ncbi:MAG TPA: ATP-binding protein [candidate division Zixibacteria bacterium]|nr:ATP-binding protein [candidate division Zixibacteria bacterium]
MRLSLFTRLFIGYVAVFALAGAVGLYAIEELRGLDRITRSILEKDNRIVEFEKRLADSHLSMVRYERKFVITRDPVLFREFERFRGDFERALDQASAVAETTVRPLLDAVRAVHQRYLEVLGEELESVRADRPYPAARIKSEKDRLSDQILAGLEKLKSERHREMLEKVGELAEAGARARRVAGGVTIAGLFFILLVSLAITRSVTRPVSLLKNKTGEIAKGRFDGDLRIVSPPEISELAASFNLMCRKLNEIDRMKADFYASMSHELRTPLTSIKEGTGLLLDGIGGETTERQKKLLRIIAEESNRLIGLVNSLLDLSKMEAGMMSYSFRRSSLAPLIHQAVGEIVPLVEAKQIKLETEIAGTLPDLNLDPERILQALRNLIGNAVKFTPKNGLVRIAAEAVDGKVRVSVKDTGPGIPPENLGTIFEKFQQARPQGPYSANGTGLGLAIAKHIITSHSGEIWAENDPEQGSRFTFALPF